MRLSICIIDEDSLRSETIKETLLEENYQVETFTSEETGLRAIVEKSFDVIFVALEYLTNSLQYVEKLRNLSPLAHVVALTSNSSADKILPLSELGVKHYIETPINSINAILSEVSSIEADVMKTEDKKNLFVSILEESKAMAKGKIPLDSAKTKKLLQKIDLAINVLTGSDNAPSQIKGDIEFTGLNDIIKIAGSIYKDGILELTNTEEKASLILKNKIIVYCKVTPSLEGFKAFSRLSSWEKGTYLFKNKQLPNDYPVDAELSTLDINFLSAEASRIKNWFTKRRANLPPKDLTLSLNSRLLEKNPHIEFTPMELEVLSHIVQFKTVKAVLDSCKLTDIEIYDTLIVLRKKGALEVKL